MIKLEVKDYCQSCPGFEANITKNDVYHEISSGHDTIIRCKYRTRCESMVRYLRKEQEKDTMGVEVNNGLVD